MGTARPLFKVDRFHDCEAKIARLERLLAEERGLRKDAETNARRFHALMLKARIDLIAQKGERT